MFNYLKKDYGDTGRIVNWMSQMVLTRLPGNEAAGRERWSRCLWRERLCLCFMQVLQVAVRWGFQHCRATPLSSWCLNASFFFLDLEVCFLENPVKRENSREGGSFSRVQTVMCPAVPDASISVGC